MIRGIDVSHYQGMNVDWHKTKMFGYEFAYLKASEGAKYKDETYLRNATNAKDQGLVIGAYHFFHPNQDVGEQVTNFLSHANIQKGDLPPALDWEVTNNVDNAHQKLRAMKWLMDVEKVVGIKPILYSSPSFLSELGDMTAFGHYKLWIANYRVTTPKLPHPWTQWTFWQTDDSHGTDVDVFNGSLEDLKALTLA